MGVRKPAVSNAAPSPSNLGRIQAQSPAQQSPERRRIAQAHLRGHLFHRKPAAFQRQPRPVQAHRLDELLRRAPSLPATCTAPAGAGGPMASCGRCRSSWTLQAIPICTSCDPLTPQAHGRASRTHGACPERPCQQAALSIMRDHPAVGRSSGRIPEERPLPARD